MDQPKGVPGSGEWLAIAALLIGVLSVRGAINFMLGDKHEYVPAYAASAAAAFYFGRRAGVVTAAGGLLVGELFVSRNVADSAWSHAIGAFGAYVATSFGIILIALRLRMDRLRTHASAASWREAEERKDRFIALLGHELRNPLASLQMGEALLKKQGLDAPAAKTLSMLERQTRHMNRLVSEVLEASRIQSGKLTLQYEMVDVAEAVGNAIADLAPTTSPKGQTVVVGTEGAAGTIEADPARLQQMLVNLLHNAAKFSPANAEIDVTIVGTAHWVKISVADSGAGIDSSELRRIFEPYVQGRAGSQGGLGLGLSLTREIARLHGGTVRAFSAGLGCGSEFLLCLPRARPTNVSPSVHRPEEDSAAIVPVSSASALPANASSPQDERPARSELATARQRHVVGLPWHTKAGAHRHR